MPICSVVPLVLPRMRPASSVVWLMKSQPPSGSLSPRAGPTVCSTSCCTGTQWVHSRVCMWAPQHASWKGVPGGSPVGQLPQDGVQLKIHQGGSHVTSAGCPESGACKHTDWMSFGAPTQKQQTNTPVQVATCPHGHGLPHVPEGHKEQALLGPFYRREK